MVLYCHAGCTVESVLGALRLEKGDLFYGAASSGEEVRYRYEDEAGAHLFDVVRKAGKRFTQEPANGKRGAGCMDGVRRVPYRLPQLLAAIRAGQPVWIVEGEKDVHAIEARGSAATCNPGGAGKWRTEYGVHFQGADVTIVADRDVAGREHASDVASKLFGAKRIRIVEAAEGKDVSDHLTAGFGLCDLAEPPADTPDSESPVVSSWAPVDLVIAAKNPPGPPDLLDLFYRGRRHWLTGEFSSGKSWIADAVLATLIQQGETVSLIDFENGPDDMLERFRLLGCTDEQISRHLLYIQPSGPIQQADVDALVRAAPVVTCIDSCADMLGVNRCGSANGETDVGNLDRLVLTPLKRAGLASIVIDHPVKAKDERGQYAEGGVGRKLDCTDVAFSVRLVEPFGRAGGPAPASSGATRAVADTSASGRGRPVRTRPLRDTNTASVDVLKLDSRRRTAPFD